MDIESMAKVLFDHVLNNRLLEVEKCFKVGDTASWRELLTYEFHFHELDLNPSQVIILELIPKLMAYEITSVTSFHMAALLGYIDLLLTLMEKDLPVDLQLKSGTTAFHMAAFAGKLKCLEILKDVFKADIHLKDRYGWTALHYASTEGHYKVVEFLLDAKVDVDVRDQDGTTAAFRAQTNNHDEVVALLCQFGAEDELLNVDDDDSDETNEDARKKQIEMMYAKPKKKKVPTATLR